MSKGIATATKRAISAPILKQKQKLHPIKTRLIRRIIAIFFWVSDPEPLDKVDWDLEDTIKREAPCNCLRSWEPYQIIPLVRMTEAKAETTMRLRWITSYLLMNVLRSPEATTNGNITTNERGHILSAPTAKLIEIEFKNITI
jgi:hypothetical protein